MKVLVATKETQGFRNNDFGHATPGELVKFAFECDGETVDGKCGCRRSMAGVDSGKATTTVKVVEMNISPDDYAQRIIDSDIAAGWGAGTGEEVADFCEAVKASAMDLLRIAADFKVGMVLEKRGNTFRERPTQEEVERKRAALRLSVGARVIIHGASGSMYAGRLHAKRSSVNAVVKVFSKDGVDFPQPRFFKVGWEQVEAVNG